MFKAQEYLQKLEKRISELEQRYADLQAQKQLISSEMKFIQLELAGFNGQVTAINLLENKSENNQDLKE